MWPPCLVFTGVCVRGRGGRVSGTRSLLGGGVEYPGEAGMEDRVSRGLTLQHPLRGDHCLGQYASYWNAFLLFWATICRLHGHKFLLHWVTDEEKVGCLHQPIECNRTYHYYKVNCRLNYLVVLPLGQIPLHCNSTCLTLVHNRFQCIWWFCERYLIISIHGISRCIVRLPIICHKNSET